MSTTAARQVCASIALIMVLAVTSASAQAPQIDQARAALNRGDSDAAIGILQKTIAQYPQSAEAHFYLGNAYGGKAQSGGMLGGMTYGPKAMGEYEKAVALNPKHVEARFSLVEFYSYAPPMMGGSTDKALEQAKEIKALDPLVGHRAYAFVYAQQKKLDLARKEYSDAISEQPKSPKPHSYFGLYLVNTEKNYAAAFSEFETALKLDPKYMPAFYHLGRTAAMGDTNRSRGEESLKKYLGYKPAETEPPLANANYWLGMLYEKEGKKAEAKASFEAALKLNPGLKLASDALKRVS